jgi:hypothetical protein
MLAINAAIGCIANTASADTLSAFIRHGVGGFVRRRVNEGPRPFDCAQGREHVERVLGFKEPRVRVHRAAAFAPWATASQEGHGARGKD